MINDNLKTRIWIGHILAIIVTASMALAAYLMGNKEIIFPEVAALVTGGLCTAKQPWNVSKPRFVVLMSVSAVVGVLLSALDVHIFVKILVGLLYSAVALYVSGTSLIPSISACILPILMGTTGIVYPLTVMIISAIIVLLQLCLEKSGIRECSPYSNKRESIAEYSKHWLFIMTAVSAYAAFPAFSGRVLLIAPPLIVTFCELMDWKGRFDNKEWKVWLAVVLCGSVGAICKMAFCNGVCIKYGQVIGALISQIAVYVIFAVLKCPFPPAAALSVLPFIINESQLMLYPIYVTITVTLIIIAAIVKRKLKLRKQKNKNCLKNAECL